MLMPKTVIYKVILLLELTTIFCFYNPINVCAKPNENSYKLIRAFEEDTRGGKVNDTVKILADVKNKGYIVEIKQNNGKTFILKPSSEFEYLAPYTTFWDINIQIADINNDTVPEIITWGQMTHENAIHIFRWNGYEYKIVYSGFNTGFDFKDITGDTILELVVDDRIYGTGDQITYLQWQKSKYTKIYYEIAANKGFDKIQGLLNYFSDLHADKFLYSSKYFESCLNNYFTEEWLSSNNNVAYVKELGKKLFSIQITRYLGEKLEFDSEGKPIEDTWRLNVLAFEIDKSKIVPKEMILTVTTRVDTNEYKIDYINFSDSLSCEKT